MAVKQKILPLPFWQVPAFHVTSCTFHEKAGNNRLIEALCTHLDFILVPHHQASSADGDQNPLTKSSSARASASTVAMSPDSRR